MKEYHILVNKQKILNYQISAKPIINAGVQAVVLHMKLALEITLLN